MNALAARWVDEVLPEVPGAVRCFVLRYRELYEEKCGYPLNDTGLWDDAPVGYLPPDTGP